MRAKGEADLPAGSKDAAGTLQLKMVARDPGPLAQVATRALSQRAWERSQSSSHRPSPQVTPDNPLMGPLLCKVVCLPLLADQKGFSSPVLLLLLRCG